MRRMRVRVAPVAIPDDGVLVSKRHQSCAFIGAHKAIDDQAVGLFAVEQCDRGF